VGGSGWLGVGFGSFSICLLPSTWASLAHVCVCKHNGVQDNSAVCTNSLTLTDQNRCVLMFVSLFIIEQYQKDSYK